MVSFCEQVFVTHAKFSLSVTHFCIGTFFCWWFPFVRISLSAKHFCLGTIYFWDGFFLWAGICHSREIQFVSQAFLHWNHFFCWWFPFVRISLSVTHFCLGTTYFGDGFFLWAGICHSREIQFVSHAFLHRSHFLLMVSFCAHKFISHAFLPRDYLFWGWFLFVSRYLSLARNSVCQSFI